MDDSKMLWVAIPALVILGLSILALNLIPGVCDAGRFTGCL